MGKTLIKVNCVDQQLFVSTPPLVASGGVNEDEVEFSFGPLWDGFVKTAVFYRDGGVVYHVLLSDDKATIPQEVLKDEGTLYFGVFGVKDGVRRTSEVLRYKIKAGAITTGTTPPEPAPDIYNQLLSKVTSAENKLTALETKVDNISVGGRNLLRDTNQGTANWDWSMQTGGKTVEEYLDGGVRAVKMTRDAVEQTGWSVISYAISEDAYALLEPNTEYTLSFDYKPSVATANGIMFSIRKFSGADAASGDGAYWKEIPANEWTHVSGQFTTVDEIPAYQFNDYCVYITRMPSVVNSVHIFKNLKLEKGNMATDWSPAPDDIKVRVTAIEEYTPRPYTLSGNPVKLDNYEGMPMDVIATFAPKQGGSGDPSPTNIRAISGWTGAKLTKCGKNLVEYQNDYTTFKPTFISVGEVYHVFASSESGNGAFNIRCLYADGTMGGDANILLPGITSGVYTYTAPKDIVGITFYDVDSSSVRGGVKTMVWCGDVADSAYVPYQGETFSATFGQTVYGGTLNWNTGVLTVDRTIKVLDGSNVKAYSASAASGKGNAFIVAASDALMPATASILSSAVCSHYPTVLGGDAYNGVQGVCVRATGAELYIYDSSRSSMTAEEYNAWLAAQSTAGTPVQVCYKLATPTTIQLTVHEIAALRGVNTLYGDGTLTVSGRKDILWLTEKLTQRIKTLESAIVAMGGNV